MDTKQINDILNAPLTAEDRAEIAQAVADYQQRPDSEKVFDLKEQDIMKVLKGSYIAKRFFGRSRSWLCHKLNHDIINGKPDDFTPEERAKLKDALDTIAYEIQILSDNL